MNGRENQPCGLRVVVMSEYIAVALRIAKRNIHLGVIADSVHFALALCLFLCLSICLISSSS